MSKYKLMYLLLFVSTTLFAIKFFEQAYRDTNIKKHGKEGVATVVELPNCGRSNNTVLVEYRSNRYTLGIGKNDCIKGVFSIGDKVNVLYSDIYNHMIIPDRKTEVLFYMSIVVWLIPLYCLYHLLKPLK